MLMKSGSSGAVAALVFPKRTRTLAQLLTSCSQVANTLNWNKKSSSSSARLLAVRLNGQQVELAFTAHPSCRLSSSSSNNNNNITIPLEQSKKYLQDLLNNNGNNTNNNAKRGGGTAGSTSRATVGDLHPPPHSTIQGLIIGWPRQPDGWLGYQCGKVFFHLLDAIETSARPAVCLFDVVVDHHHHHHHHPTNQHNTTPSGDDVWGRNPVYGRRTAAALSNRPHIASREQYYYYRTSNNNGAVELAEQFCREHWPEYYQVPPQQHDDDGPFSLSHHASMWDATSSFHGSLLPRSAPGMMVQHQHHHGWMSTSSSNDHDHQQATAATGSLRQRSLASA